MCREAGQAGCVASPSAKKSLPTPTQNNPPQNYGFVAERRAANASPSVCVCVCAFACMPSRDPTDGTAHQQRALDLDEGQRLFGFF